MTVRQLSADEVTRLRELDAKAAPGPWKVNRYDNPGGEISWQVQQDVAPHRVIAESSDLPGEFGRRAKPTAHLMAESRNALPTLLAAYEERGAVIMLLAGRAQHNPCTEPETGRCNCGLSELKDRARRARE